MQGNLKPTNTLTTYERVELSKKAGKASGKARREKRDLRVALDALLSGKVQDPNNANKSITGAEKVALSVFTRAARGDVRAAQFVAEMVGEYKQTMQVESHVKVKQRTNLSVKEAVAFMRELETII